MMQDDSGNIPRTDRQGKLESVGISFLFIALFWTLVLGALAGWNYYQTCHFAVRPAYALGYGGLWGLGLYFIVRHRARLRDHLRMGGQVKTLLRERTRELEERGAELERFNYTVFHDLKSPLVTVKSFLGFLEDDLKAQDARRIQMETP